MSSIDIQCSPRQERKEEMRNTANCSGTKSRAPLFIVELKQHITALFYFGWENTSPRSEERSKKNVRNEYLDCLRQQNWPRGVSAHADASGNRNTPTHSASPDCRSAGGNPSPPDLVLIPHCAECEFQTRCRQKAEEKDDLSLLSGMTEKERRNLHDKGILTVTQLS